jgi:creatinine amidohydrolase
MNWQELKSSEIGALAPDTFVVVPIASLEQHGPHLPVGTDSYIAEGIAAALDRELEGRLLILPVQRLGCSEHHMAFPGTLTLQHETFAGVILEALESMVRHDFRRFLILNGHGGNQAIGAVITEKASQRWPDVQVVFTSWWRIAAERLKKLVEGAYPSVGHACEFETSLMLALHPELVNMELAVDDGLPPSAKPLQHDLLTGPAASLAIPMHRLTQHGVYGRPTLASAEKGRRILEASVAALRDLLVACWPYPLPNPGAGDTKPSPLR